MSIYNTDVPYELAWSNKENRLFLKGQGLLWIPERGYGQQVKCVVHGQQSSPLLMGNPCPGEPGTSLHAIPSIYPCSTISLGLEIEESEWFGATDLPGGSTRLFIITILSSFYTHFTRGRPRYPGKWQSLPLSLTLSLLPISPPLPSYSTISWHTWVICIIIYSCTYSRSPQWGEETPPPSYPGRVLVKC